MDATYFEELIRIHQEAISSSKKWGMVLVIAGVGILLLASVAWILVLRGDINSNLAPSLVSIIGSFVSASSLLPYKEITPRRITIAKYTQLQTECERIKQLPSSQQESRIREMNQLLSEFQ
jgi:hypothetical protein